MVERMTCCDTLCHRCQQRVRADLTTILVNYQASADPSLTPLGTGTGAPHRIPGGTAWLDWRTGADTLPILKGWADDWSERYRLTRTPRTWKPLLLWLLNNLTTAVDHPAIHDFREEIHTIARRSRRYAGESDPPRAKLYCPAITPQGEDCAATIWITTGDPHDPIRCRTCGAEWTRIQLEHIALNTQEGPDAWVDCEAAARYAHVNETTVRRWARDGKVDRKGGLYNLKTLHAQRLERT